MNQRPGLALLLLLPLVGACVTQPPAFTPPAENGLFTWVDRTLVPHLVGQLRTRPRLRGARIAVVRLEEGRISPHIDGLTLDLRQRIGDGLARYPEVRQAWRPDLRRLRPGQRPRPECRDLLRADFLIGIDTGRDTDGRLRVAVRLLDPTDETQVGGAGLVWRGHLTPAQARARRRLSEDRLLRGLRPLPFRADQLDLAAAWLADSFSCRLRRRGLSGKAVRILPPGRAPAALARLSRLLDDYLSQLGEVRITQDTAHADYLLRLDQTPLGKGLTQVWLSLEPRGRRERVSGLDIGAYLDLGDTAPSPPVSSIRPRPPRILGIEVEHPRDPGLCGTPYPWRSGRLALAPDAGLAAGECFRPRIRTQDADHLFLLWLGPGGGLRRLPEKGCGPTLTAPGRSGVASLYALASRGRTPTRDLRRLLAELPGACPQTALSPPPEDWPRRLDHLLRHHFTAIAWRVRRIRVEGEAP